MSRRLSALALVVLGLMVAPQALAVSCGAVFANAVGTTGGELKLDGNPRLHDTGDRILATDDLSSGGNYCDGGACIASGTPAASPGLPSNPSQNSYSGTLLSLSAGDYYYKDFDLQKKGKLTVSSGTVRIHVAGKLVLDEQTQVNKDGGAEDLVFLVGGDVDVKKKSKINAMIYAGGAVVIDGGGNSALQLTGAITGDSVEVKDKAQVTFDADAIASADFGGFCGEDAVVADPFAAFSLDQPDLDGTAGELIDEQGNVTSAYAIGTSSGVQSTETARICGGLVVPDNASPADRWGFDTGVDADDDIGAQGGMTFWYRAASDWDSGQQRMLLDASQDSQSNAKYFHLSVTAEGRLYFRIEDSDDEPIDVQSSVQPVGAGTWKHIGVTWDLPNDTYRLYIDGVLAATDTDASSGALGELQTFYVGDNRSDYQPGGSVRSANGIIDEVRFYAAAVDASVIAADFARSGECPSVNPLDAYAEFRFEESAGTYDGTPGEVGDAQGASTGAYANGSASGVDTIADGRICRALTIPDNSGDRADYFIDTGVDLDSTLGDAGSISFWYRSHSDWDGGGDRMLLDASEHDHRNAKYFFLELQNNGRLHFRFEDSSDSDIDLKTPTQAFPARTWTHLAITWDLPNDVYSIYINGALARSDSEDSNGRLGTLENLVIGDARTDYHPEGTGNSANGDFDEVRLYNRALSAEEVANDYADTRACDDEPLTVDAGGFNCVVAGAEPINGHLYLQKVGTAFAFDVVALRDSDGNGGMDAIETEYAADADRSVTVEWVDGSAGGSCASLPTLSPGGSQAVVFSAGNGGRVTTSATLGIAHPHLRCRVTDATPDPDVVACSTDGFAVRPEALTLGVPVMTNADHLGVPKAVAGSLFTLVAEGGPGYSGTPAVDPSRVSAHAGALAVGTLTGVFPAADALTGTATAVDAFSYNEVGNFRLSAQGLYDDSFAAVDIANGDCTDDFSNFAVGGRYGCRFGNTTDSAWVGRFHPAGFVAAVQGHGALTGNCGGFSYQGQAVALAGDVVFRITAKALGGSTTTRNYTGDYANLETGGLTFSAVGTTPGVDGATPVTTGWTTAGSKVLTDLGAGDPALGGQHDVALSGAGFTWGVEPPGQRVTNDRVAPFTTALQIRLDAIDEADVGSALSGPVTASPIGVEMRYGRLAIGNAHGSELQHLQVPIRAEYFGGASSGFVPSAGDSCSTLLGVAVTDLNAADGLVPAETCVWDDDNDSSLGCTGAGPAGMEYEPALSGGSANFFLRGPGAGNTGVLGIQATAPDYLRFNWLGTGDVDPSARATFGIFNRATSVIYQREVR